MSNELVRAFEYHAWATDRLISFCLTLTVEQRQFTADGTTGTIERTLTHLVSSEQFYLKDLTGEDPPTWIEERVAPIEFVAVRAVENPVRWSST